MDPVSEEPNGGQADCGEVGEDRDHGDDVDVGVLESRGDGGRADGGEFDRHDHACVP